MVRALILLACLAACSAPPANPFPEDAHAAFNKSCPAGDPHCVCAWDKITHAMTYEEYQAVMDKFTKDGIMDHRLTVARAACVDAQ